MRAAPSFEWTCRIALPLSILAGLLLLALAGPCRAQTVIVALLPGTTLQDWRLADAPTLHRLMNTGSIAVMNSRSARTPSDRDRETPESETLTLGAGSRANANAVVARFHEADRIDGDCTYGEMYTRRTGLAVTSEDLVDPDWELLQAQNRGRGYDILPGNLGSALDAKAVTVEAFGGSYSALVACNRNGWVRGQAELPSPGPSFGAAGPRFLIYDLGGDVRTADRQLSTLADRIQAGHGRLVVVSPFVDDASWHAGRRLCPVVVWGEGVPDGLLYSPSTHTAGLVTNTDFAPTIAAWFHGERLLPSLPFGRPWGYRSGSIASLIALQARAYRQWSALKALPIVAVAVGLVMVAGLVGARFLPRAAPMLFLLPQAAVLALASSTSPVSIAIWFAVLIALGSVIAGFFGLERTNVLVAAAIAALLVVDTVVGNPLMHVGLLGYSVVEGARYYGIGNEAMGALLGASLAVAGGLWRSDRRVRFVLAVGLAVVAALVAAPGAGAKAGSALVMLPSFGTLLWTLSGRRYSWRAGAVLGLIGIAAIIAVVIVDVVGGGVQTHVGQAIHRIAGAGWREAIDIAVRKLAVEARLLSHSAWALPFWIGVGGLAGNMRINRGGSPRSGAVFIASAVAVVTCVLFNDAGTVAAVLCMCTLWPSWFRNEKSALNVTPASHF